VIYPETIFPFSALRGAAPTGAKGETMAFLGTFRNFFVNLALKQYFYLIKAFF